MSVNKCYQLFLWKENLDPAAPTEVWVVRTLIYGVRPSGNLMMAAFKLLSDFCYEHSPDHKKGGDILRLETYVTIVCIAPPMMRPPKKMPKVLDMS